MTTTSMTQARAHVRLAIGVAAALASAPALAAPQGKPPQTPQVSEDGTRIAAPIAAFSGLDKITGRIISFDVAIDETVQFGALQVTPRVCYARPQTVAPLTTSFVEVDEITLDNKIRRIFTGWMYADSPGLHAVEHAVYDVWLTDCRTSSPDAAAAAKAGIPAGAAEPPPPKPALPAAAPAAAKPQAPAPVAPAPAANSTTPPAPATAPRTPVPPAPAPAQGGLPPLQPVQQIR